MTRFLEFLDRLERTPRNLAGARVLQVVAGVVILYRIATELPYARFFWERDGIAIGSLLRLLPWSPATALWLDSVFYSEWGVRLSLILWTLAAVGLIVGRQTRLSALAALFVYLLLEVRSNTHDAGDNILRLLLLYMALFHPNLRRPLEIRPGPAVFFHNLGVAAVYLQVMTLYWVSGTTKLGGADWVNGTALYYVTQVNWFRPGWGGIANAFKNSWIVTLATYSSIVYQVGFPFMIFTRGHLPWIAFGIAFHLSIAVVMGLISFSATIIGVLLFTVRDQEWATIGRWFSRFLRHQGEPPELEPVTFD